MHFCYEELHIKTPENDKRNKEIKILELGGYKNRIVLDYEGLDRKTMESRYTDKFGSDWLKHNYEDLQVQKDKLVGKALGLPDEFMKVYTDAEESIGEVGVTKLDWESLPNMKLVEQNDDCIVPADKRVYYRQNQLIDGEVKEDKKTDSKAKSRKKRSLFGLS